MLHPSANFGKPAPSQVLDRKREIKIGLPWYKDGRLIIGDVYWVSGAGLYKLLLRVDRLLVKPAPTGLLRKVHPKCANTFLWGRRHDQPRIRAGRMPTPQENAIYLFEGVWGSYKTHTIIEFGVGYMDSSRLISRYSISLKLTNITRMFLDDS